MSAKVVFSIHLIHGTADAALEFGLQPGIGVFIQEQFANFGVLLGEMNDCLGRTNARIANL